jgi:hypothetical protein
MGENDSLWEVRSDWSAVGALGEGFGAQDDGESWVDPLFQGPAPLGDLPGVGSRYRDLAFLGEGASARVFRAFDVLLQRQVALKVLKRDQTPPLAEARALARVEHPNVCRIYEVGRGFIVMQLVEGPTLARLAPSLDLGAKVQVLRDLARGVHAAHQRGLLHLDLKMSNILMQPCGDGTFQPIVGDFGMVVERGTALAGACPKGTPPYSSPEQLEGDASRLGPASDLHALGVIMLFLLGRVRRPGASAVAGDGGSDLPDPGAVGLPVDLAALIRTCLIQDPAARLGNAQDLAEELGRFLNHEPLRVMGRPWPYRARTWFRRNRKSAVASALGVAVLLVLTGILVHRNDFHQEQAEWDRHFQKEVEDLRAKLQMAYRLPFHCIDPELKLVRSRIQAMGTEIASHGSAAHGPGCLALGQARLLVDSNDAQAPALFRQAWEGGFRTESVRNWLVISLLRELEDAQSSLLRKGGDPDRLRETYLRRARKLLEGRGDSDQARLAHQTRLAEALGQKTWSPDQGLQLARTYRSQFPDDLDGMLEEARAMGWKADALWRTKEKLAKGWPPQDVSEVVRLRAASRAILLNVVRIAPSYPQVYSSLADSYLTEDLLPTAPVANHEQLLKLAKEALEHGLEVSPADPVLFRTYALLLGDAWLGLRLHKGDAPTQVRNQLLHMLDAACSSGDEDRQMAALDGIHEYVTTCGLHGMLPLRDLASVSARVFERWRPGQGSDSFRLALAYWGLWTGATRFEAGEDPTSILARVMEVAGSGPDALFVGVQAELLAARVAKATGGDPGPHLDSAGRFLARHRQTQARQPEDGDQDMADVLLGLARCQVRGADGDWAALPGLLARAEQAMGSDRFLDYAPILDGRLVLAEREKGASRTALLDARRVLLAAQKSGDQPSRNLLEAEVRLRLLEAGGTPQGGALLIKAGLAEAEQLLEGGSGIASWQAVRWEAKNRPSWFETLHPARTLLLKAELQLALARVERSPSGRANWGRAALRSLRQARARNPFLEGDLAPLRREAARLAGMGR